MTLVTLPEKKREIPVDSIRRLTESLMLASTGWRVGILHPADALNSEAANALLKLFEEPPDRVTLILVCNGFARLPPTLRSRCMVMQLSPPPFDTALPILAAIAPTHEEEDRKAALLLANCRPGQALRLLETGALEGLAELFDLTSELPSLHQDRLASAHEKMTGGATTPEERFTTLFETFCAWLAGRIIELTQEPSGKESPSILAASGAAIASRERKAHDRLAELLSPWRQTGRSPATLIASWERAIHHGRVTQWAHLDKRFPVTGLFHDLANTLRNEA